MPIYEHYCPDCHTVFSFLSPSSSPGRLPSCPRCQRPELERKPSTFAALRGGARGTGDDADLPEGIDESRLEGAMESVLGDLGEGAEDDPRQMAHLLRRFGEAAGMEPGPRMEEMLRRLDAGEDPESVEGELEGGSEGEGDSLDDFFRAKRQGKRRKTGRPLVDKELYFL